jgi:hypothetical protein
MRPNLLRQGGDGAEPGGRRTASEKDAKLTQKLGQHQPFTAVLPQECMGQLASFLGRPNSFVAAVEERQRRAF